jgi:hypothetical protein
MANNYEMSVQLWIDGQELLIKELELKVDFTMQNIIVSQKVLQNASESLMHEIKQLNEFIKTRNHGKI